MMVDALPHDESLLLPWLANGRLSGAERVRLEEHVRDCAACAQELVQQRLMCQALTAPERVTYAPGPSFRKLMERIDGRTARRHTPRRRMAVIPLRSAVASAWRPPGLAWAASFLLMLGCGVFALTAYRWTQPLYATHTAAAPRAADVLHIAFVPSLSIGDAGKLLREAGARVVEGPDATGIFGVTPVASAPGEPSTQDVSPEMRALAARLRADARVRWVEPLSGSLSTPGTSAERQPPRL
ncbi:MAG TPA: zf-HC2 domain-containing protein [Steroidobacteraceae bacterium]|nr:zf-HC2 domain-containing protein [Steroidobacteraceae bacterium]